MCRLIIKSRYTIKVTCTLLPVIPAFSNVDEVMSPSSGAPGRERMKLGEDIPFNPDALCQSESVTVNGDSHMNDTEHYPDRRPLISNRLGIFNSFKSFGHRFILRVTLSTTGFTNATYYSRPCACEWLSVRPAASVTPSCNDRSFSAKNCKTLPRHLQQIKGFKDIQQTPYG